MGGLVRNITGRASSRELPDKSQYGNPYAEDLLARMLAAIDTYNNQHGAYAAMPEEQRPYELRSDEERRAIRAREEQDAKDEDRPKRRFAVNEPDENDPITPTAAADEEGQKGNSADLIRDVFQRKAAAETQGQSEEGDEKPLVPWSEMDPKKKRVALGAILNRGYFSQNGFQKQPDKQKILDLISKGGMF